MQAVINAATSLFNWFFVGTTGANAVPAAMTSLVSFVVGNDYVLIGVGLMLVGSCLGFLRRLIAST